MITLLLLLTVLLVTLDTALHVVRRQSLTRFEVKQAVKEALVEYGVQQSPSRQLLESIVSARARAAQDDST